MFFHHYTEVDHQLDLDARYKLEKVLVKNKVKYEVTVYSSTQHGFAVRTDLSDPEKRFAKESAFFQAVRWFDYWVKK
jgi:dienelactone hydrolase